MSDSTSILDLPTDPVGGGNISNNISMSATENVAPQSGQPQAGLSLDQSTISQIVNGLQQASITGDTQLPSRDIPMTTSGHSTDPQIQPNYVPQPQTSVDYIKNYEQTADMIDEYNKNSRQQNATPMLKQLALDKCLRNYYNQFILYNNYERFN